MRCFRNTIGKPFTERQGNRIEGAAQVSMNQDLPVQFAVLWGIEIADSRADEAVYTELSAYDSQELYQMFQGWAGEYLQSNSLDTVEFFEEKLRALLSGIRTKDVESISGRSGQEGKTDLESIIHSAVARNQAENTPQVKAKEAEPEL